MNLTNILIVLSSLAGLYITYRIRAEKKKKASGGQMVCMVGHDCSKVVFSDYSKFLGLNLETMGFVYYATTLLIYLTAIAFPQIITDFVIFLSLGITFGGFLFSIYLTFIQVFRLKNLCTWCLASAASSTLIFIFALIKTLPQKEIFGQYLSQLGDLIRTVGFIGLVVGIAAATVLEIMIFIFLKDFEISKEENRVIKIVMQISWLALFLFILSNVGIYLGNIKPLAGAEILVIAFLIVNYAFSSIQILPELTKYNFNITSIKVRRACSLRQIAFVQSAVAITSWYFLFYLEFMASPGMSNGEVLRNYFLIIAGFAAIIQLFLFWYDKPSRQN